MAQARQDFRVHFGFFRNVKTRKLDRRLGDAGVVALIKLWAYTGENHPKGRLGDVSDDHIEDCADWRGEEGKFAACLWDLRWLDRHGKYGVVLHDWKEHQEFLYSRDKRVRRSQTANKAKRAKGLRRNLQGDRPGGLSGDRKRTKTVTPSSSSAPASSRGGGGADAAPSPDGSGGTAQPTCSKCSQQTPVVTPDGGLCFACSQKETA